MRVNYRDPSWEEAMQTSRRLVAEGKGEEALAILDRLLERLDISPDTHLLRAQLLADRGRHAEAILACWRASAVAPCVDTIEPLIRLSRARDKSGTCSRLLELAARFEAAGWKDFAQERSSLGEFIFRWQASQAISETDIVLDVSAGECNDRAFFEHAQYVAFDLAIGSETWDYSRIDIHGDVHDMPVRAGTVDAIVNFVSMEHYRDPALAFREFARILKPGGRIYLTAPMTYKEHQIPHDYFRYTRYGLQALAEQAGLKTVSVTAGNTIYKTATWLMETAVEFLRTIHKLDTTALTATLQEQVFPLLKFADGLGNEASNQFPILFRLIAEKPGEKIASSHFPTREALLAHLGCPLPPSGNIAS